MRQLAGVARRLEIQWPDVAIAAGLTIWAVLEDLGPDANLSPAVLLATVPLVVRRRWPVGVLALAIAGFGIAGNATGLAALLGGLTATVSLGLYSRHQNVAWMAVLAAATFIAIEFGQGSTTTLPIPGALLPFLLIGAAYLAGREIGARRKELRRQRDRTARLEAEREAAVKSAAEAERRHIARELHDVIAHSVSLMVVQAGAARQVVSEKPETALESLKNVERVGHETMAELRRLLGVLGTNGSEAPPLRPQPGMDSLESLIQGVRDSGLPVELRIEGSRRPLPAGVDVASYRIVQEALTNALRYAGSARTEVVVRYGVETIDLDVADEGLVPTAADGIGRGLIGMRERVALFGGTIEAGKRPQGGYAVHAQLPLTQSS